MKRGMYLYYNKFFDAVVVNMDDFKVNSRLVSTVASKEERIRRLLLPNYSEILDAVFKPQSHINCAHKRAKVLI